MGRSLGPLTEGQVLEGYSKAVANAIDLLDSHQKCLPTAPAVALALAQIGQEELGKAYLLLAAAGSIHESGDWTDFWRGWRDHDRKAHAAFLFEWFNPLRIQVATEDGTVLDGLPMRRPISAEKSGGLYVDFDPDSGQFVQPREKVLFEEAAARGGALIMLGNTAMQIQSLVTETDTALRLRALGRLARHVDEAFPPQQAMPALIESIAEESAAHSALVDAYRKRLPWNWQSEDDDDQP